MARPRHGATREWMPGSKYRHYSRLAAATKQRLLYKSPINFEQKGSG